MANPNSIDPPPFAELAELAKLAARVGGATLLHWRGRFAFHEKGPADLVTDADLASQQAVRGVLLGARPDDVFVGEEDETTLPPAAHPGRVVWVVDPLDGTTNYVHGFPAFATSIAATIDGLAVAGAIFDPLRDELYWAVRGGGAWLGTTPLRVSDAKSLSEAVVAVSLPAHVARTSPDLADFVELSTRARGVRRTGSAALNLAYVAAGRLDAHGAQEIRPWDGAAGTLLVEEAGGVVTARRGGPYDLWKADYLTASTAELHAELLSLGAEPPGSTEG
ncbi:MAG: inositol monophosphatase family protein [Lacipirellulaceae bacterium]